MKKSTKELLELMKTSSDYRVYLANNKENISDKYMMLDRALNSLLIEKNVKKSIVIAKSGIETHYAYQIFSGKKVPLRDKVIMLCFGFDLNVDETQDLLRLTGYNVLYSKELRDNAILFGITKKLSIIEMNSVLYDLDLELLK